MKETLEQSFRSGEAFTEKEAFERSTVPNMLSSNIMTPKSKDQITVVINT
jgi:hypothetical protein